MITFRIPGELVQVVRMDELNAYELVEYAAVGFRALTSEKDQGRFASKLFYTVSLGFDGAAECGLIDETLDYLEARTIIGQLASEALYGSQKRS